jgi:ferredoxin--NADP+ reductase
LYEIVAREDLAPGIHRYQVASPAVARKAQPGQFVIIMVDEKGERIPLTIAGWDRERGTLGLVFSVVGITTRKLAGLQPGDAIFSLTGPLGLPAEVENFGTVVMVAVGYSVATSAPVVQALKEAGNKIISIMRAPSADSLFGEQGLGGLSDELIVVTGDGSYGECGFVTEPLENVLLSQQVDRVLTIGPVCVMRLVASTTRPFGVKTIASLNPIMVDGTGMCGCCRVTVGGKTRFACVDGPEFDAHEVDWDSLLARRCTYASSETNWARYRCLDCAQW